MKNKLNKFLKELVGEELEILFLKIIKSNLLEKQKYSLRWEAKIPKYNNKSSESDIQEIHNNL
jgi:hypothetical protein